MSWDEKLFGMLARAVRRFRQGHAADSDTHASFLAPNLDRFSMVASLLAERVIEVREAESCGGWQQSILWLPHALCVGVNQPVNEVAFLYRVLFSATSLRMGYTLASAESSLLRVAFLSALAAGPTHDSLCAELPGVASMFSQIAAQVQRPLTQRHSTERQSAVTAFVHARMGANLAAVLPQVPLGLHAWLRDAIAASPTPEDLAEAGSVLWKELESIVPAARADDTVVPWCLWGVLMPPMQRTTLSLDVGQIPESALSRGTERKSRARERVEHVPMQKNETEDNPLVHSFEKVHTAEEYKGGSKRADGSDEMAEHAEALEDLDLREVVRSHERTGSLLRLDAMFEGTAGDLQDDGNQSEGISYDEWDGRTQSYRPSWCTVRVGTPLSRVTPERAGLYVQSVVTRCARQIDALRTDFTRIMGERAWCGRQREGTELDLDQLVDRHASLTAHRTPTDRLWVARRRHERGLAVLILLDASLSSDGWVMGRRVIDVEREAVIVLGEALDGIHEEIGIAAFHSNTRRDCRYIVVKGLSEPWTVARSRIPDIEPAGYTRIGPALRHGNCVLGQTRARRKLLLLVSDGRPTDFDRYEGRYGLADVRQAIREGESQGVSTFTLAVDPRSRTHLPEMMGAGRYEVLSRPEDLSHAVGMLVGRLLR